MFIKVVWLVVTSLCVSLHYSTVDFTGTDFRFFSPVLGAPAPRLRSKCTKLDHWRTFFFMWKMRHAANFHAQDMELPSVRLGRAGTAFSFSQDAQIKKPTKSWSFPKEMDLLPSTSLWKAHKPSSYRWSAKQIFTGDLAKGDRYPSKALFRDSTQIKAGCRHSRGILVPVQVDGWDFPTPSSKAKASKCSQNAAAGLSSRDHDSTESDRLESACTPHALLQA